VAKTTDRRRSREMALQVLYQMEHGNASAEEALALFVGNFDAPQRQLNYTRNLVLGIAEHAAEIDEALSNVSRRWKLTRMARVDRNILRLAGYEIMFTEGKVPPKVAINEAVELAKRFSGDDSPSFINAVLDNLVGFKQQAD
jgi:N utilization substance protein B